VTRPIATTRDFRPDSAASLLTIRWPSWCRASSYPEMLSVYHESDDTYVTVPSSAVSFTRCVLQCPPPPPPPLQVALVLSSWYGRGGIVAASVQLTNSVVVVCHSWSDRSSRARVEPSDGLALQQPQLRSCRSAGGRRTYRVTYRRTP